MSAPTLEVVTAPLWYGPVDVDPVGPDAVRALRAGPAPGPGDRERCRRCHHPIRVAVSLGYHLGPTCRRKLGITGRRRGPASWRSGRIPRADPNMPGQQQIPDLLTGRAPPGPHTRPAGNRTHIRGRSEII